jgi:hypothetical protein
MGANTRAIGPQAETQAMDTQANEQSHNHRAKELQKPEIIIKPEPKPHRAPGPDTDQLRDRSRCLPH